MYDASDPRASLSAAPKAAPTPNTEFAGAEYARFYEEEPQEAGPEGRTWYVRGQNFVVAYTEAEPGATFSRVAQPDEYVVLIPDAETSVEIAAGAEANTHVRPPLVGIAPALEPGR